MAGPNPHPGHPIHIHPAPRLHRFFATALPAAMWFFVCASLSSGLLRLHSTRGVELTSGIVVLPSKAGRSCSPWPETPLGSLSISKGHKWRSGSGNCCHIQLDSKPSYLATRLWTMSWTSSHAKWPMTCTESDTQSGYASERTENQFHMFRTYMAILSSQDMFDDIIQAWRRDNAKLPTRHHRPRQTALHKQGKRSASGETTSTPYPHHMCPPSEATFRSSQPSSLRTSPLWARLARGFLRRIKANIPRMCVHSASH